MKRTMTLKASTTVRIHHFVIDAIGEIVNKEHPSPCQPSSSSPDIPSTSQSSKTVTKSTDCRVFGNFINVTSIRKSTLFMSANADDEIRAQISSLQRTKE